MFPPRTMLLPPTVNDPAVLLNTNPPKLVSATKSLVGVRRVVPPNCRISPATAAMSSAQFNAVVQLSSPPPPSQICPGGGGGGSPPSVGATSTKLSAIRSSSNHPRAAAPL